MNRWFLFLGFTAVLCLFVVGEFFLNNPGIFRFAPKTAQMDDSLSSHFPISLFSQVGITNIAISQQKEVQHFFHEVAISPDDQKMRVLRTLFIQKQNEEDVPFLVLYEFFSSRETTVIDAYSEIKETLKKAISDDPESDINENDAFGDMSFYENLGNDKKTVYLVVAFGDKIYGFEYPRANHLEIKKLYDALFPTQ
jgi:GH15 family glucan-1,4-alpha-glucosidase